MTTNTQLSDHPTINIEPTHGLAALRLRDVWAYRELLYFLVWRDIKVRYKQTLLGVLWVILKDLTGLGEMPRPPRLAGLRAALRAV